MGFWRRDGHGEVSDPVAATRWAEAAEGVTDRFARFDGLPLEEAVEAAMVTAPANFTREELTHRLAARRGLQPDETV